MPYQSGNRLPAEKASKLGHLEVLKSELVKKFCESFVNNKDQTSKEPLPWKPIPTDGKELSIVFGVDGSLQTITDDLPPYKSLAFVKTALLRLDQVALSTIDKESPHPFALKDILANSAMYHATVFPLRNVTVSGFTVYDAVRQAIFESLKDSSLDGEPFETLKWIVYKKWDGISKPLEEFECPHCGHGKAEATLKYDQEEGPCPKCGKKLFLTDMLGFHQEMITDAAPDTIASTYMSIHETLLLFTGIRLYWEGNREILKNCIFIKDGPLSIRAQYSKIVEPIRQFIQFAKEKGININIIGQEKTGRFYDHLQLIGRDAPNGHIFIPNNKYIKEQIQNRPDEGADYGFDTNYGVKVFVKLNNYHKMVLNIPTGKFITNPTISDLVGAKDIFKTIPSILGNRHEGALLPIELANGIASLSTYPSAKVLKIFAESSSKNSR